MKALIRVLFVEATLLVGATLLILAALVLQHSYSDALAVAAHYDDAPGEVLPTPTPTVVVARLAFIAAGQLPHSSGPTPVPAPPLTPTPPPPTATGTAYTPSPPSHQPTSGRSAHTTIPLPNRS